jgi:hypothetical protein
VKKSSKVTIMSVVTALTFTLGASPAMALSQPVNFAQPENLASQAALAQQNLVATDATLTDDSLETMVVGASAPDASESGGDSDFEAADISDADAEYGYDVDAAIELAKSELGTSRATGWDQEGECVMSVRRWVTAGDAAWNSGGTPVANYKNAKRVPLDSVQRGDILQYENMQFPDQWVSGVHTMLVTGVNKDGSLQIIQSNVPYGSGLVTEEDHFTPKPPAGFTTSAWRF